MSAETLLAFAWLIPALPLAAALAIGLRLLLATLPPAWPPSPEADRAERLSARLAGGSGAASLLGLLLLDAAAVAGTLPDSLHFGDWFALGPLRLPLGFALDPLALAIATLWALLGTLALLFSLRYMHREPGFHRFLAGLCLLLAAMLAVVLADNAGLAFVGWELGGLASWLLIGYAQERPVASGNALRAFVTNRIGDAAFLMSLGFAVLLAGSLEWSRIAAAASNMETVPAALLASGFIVAALAKSAQLPFSPWLGRALEGPTPSSAIFYGSLLVHAGVYLLLRLEPVLRHVPELLLLLAVIGLATALYATLCGLVQSDVKSSLMFATLAQVGLMVLACGLGWFTLAAWHLGLHAAFRCWQFLASPSWLLVSESPAPTVGRWLASRQWLYAAALNRGWVEALGDTLLVEPTTRLGRDMDSIDERLLRPTLGLPVPDATATDPAPDAGSGLASHLLSLAAGRLDRFEQHLLVRSRDGRIAVLLRRVGDYLQALELLFEQPRYLFLFVMATLVVIL